MSEAVSTSRAKKADDAPFETMLSRFGTRFTINPLVRQGVLRISPVGTYHWGERRLQISVHTGSDFRDIPFGKKPFADIHQSLRMTSVDYCASDPDFPLQCELAFIAPFYPQDFSFCSVPVIYVLAYLRNTSGETVDARLEVSLGEDGRSVEGAAYSAKIHDFTCKGSAGAFQAQVAAGFLSSDSAKIAPNGEKIIWGVLAGYVPEPVLDVKGIPYSFEYTKRFKNIEDILAYAAANRDRELRKNEVFESTVFDSSLTPEMKELISFGFQSFVANTWLAQDASGNRWFSVWEGNCGYHSTIDVEYNQAPFYLQYWPELLRMLFDEWASCKTDPGFMEHDMGLWGTVKQAEYGHPMKVEENTNFLLMLASYRKTTGDTATARRHYPLAKELCEFLFSCDTTGNGFQDEGCENTLDSGSYVVELSKDQSYLAVKCITSWLMIAEIAEEMGDEGFAVKLRSQAAETLKTIDAKGWIGDHYAVCLDQKVRGWNTYTMMVDNGLFYPLRAGFELPFRMDRIALNLYRSLQETTRSDSQRMTAVDNNGWFSQQMFRDMIAAHLGLDLSNSWADYLAYQKRVNREESNCYKDVWPPEGACLNYYPRGLAASGMLQSMGGITVNAFAKKVTVSPAVLPIRLPLTMLADWRGARIPWVEVSAEGKLSVTGPLPAGWRVLMGQKPSDEQSAVRPAGMPAGPEFFLYWGEGEVSGRHGYWSPEEMLQGKPFEVRVWFRVGRESARDLNIAVTSAPGIEITPLDEEAFTTLGPGELLQYKYRVRILPEYTWGEEPAIRAACFFRTQDTNVTLPERTLMFTKDPRKKFIQQDVARQEAGYRGFKI